LHRGNATDRAILQSADTELRASALTNQLSCLSATTVASTRSVRHELILCHPLYVGTIVNQATPMTEKSRANRSGCIGPPVNSR
jgi:hypothetical protein